MALYPLALDLDGKPVLVVGGGPAAGRKLPALLAAGAKVTLVSPALCPETSRLRSAFEHRARPFEERDVTGMRLVFACTATPDVNAAVAEAARNAGAWCVRLDDGSAGDFQVPAVLRRGALTVTVATGGKSPGLTRALKRKLAGSLSPSWSDLAERLAGLRSAPNVEGDRADWPYDALLDAAADKGAERALAEWLERKNSDPYQPAAERRRGKVLLVGAGPGAKGMLSLDAAEALRQAEVLVHDRLVGEEILALAQEGCERIPAGKRGHFQSMRQSDIDNVLIDRAGQGKTVVRLKGGDPFVFGRGFEEAQALEAAGLEWRVVPGISSANGAAAAAGIPLTHRGIARSVAFLSGMTESGETPSIPKADTLVLFMSLHRLESLLPALVAAGYGPKTPCAAIQDGTLPSQRVLRAPLHGLAEACAHAGFDSPTLILVGAVTALGSA